MSASKKARAFSLPIPVAFDSVDAVADLSRRLRCDAAIYAIRLWHRSFRSGEVVSGDNAAGIVEHHCGWPVRKGGQLFAAMKAVGLVVEIEGGARIVPWQDLARVEWMGAAGVDATVEDVDPAPKLSRAERDRIRKAEKYAETKRATAEKADSTAESVATGAENSPHVSAASPHRAENSPQDCGESAEKNGLQGARATGTGTEPVTDTEKSEEHSSAVADAVRVTPPKSIPKADGTEAAITEVLEHWREVVWLSKPGNRLVAIEGSGSDKRRSRIRSRFAEGRTVEELKQVSDGALHSDWHMGRDPKAPDGFRDVETLFRDDSQVEKFIGLARNPTKPRASRQLYDPKTTVYEENDKELMAEIMGHSR